MGIKLIPKTQNVGVSCDDINANFAYLESLRSEGSDKSVSFTQETSASVWVILHNLSKYPSVTVIDNYGELTLCETEYTNENTVTLRFSEPTAGTVYLN